MAPTATATAKDVLEVIPIAMRFIKAQMREHGAADLSVPQFRSLLFIRSHSGSPLGEVAEHLGLTAPSTSKLVDGLERRALVERRDSSTDRRKVTLAITPEGDELLDRAARATRKSISAAMAALPPQELRAIELAMSALKRAFSATKRDKA
jgi:DNA-binding MarR family transcriptional regulator